MSKPITNNLALFGTPQTQPAATAAAIDLSAKNEKAFAVKSALQEVSIANVDSIQLAISALHLRNIPPPPALLALSLLFKNKFVRDESFAEKLKELKKKATSELTQLFTSLQSS